MLLINGVEILTPGGAVHTRDFRRSLQLDDYNCGARSVYAVLRHFGAAMPYRLVTLKLKTRPDRGTAVRSMIRLLRGRALRVGVPARYVVARVGWSAEVRSRRCSSR